MSNECVSVLRDLLLTFLKMLEMSASQNLHEPHEEFGERHFESFFMDAVFTVLQAGGCKMNATMLETDKVSDRSESVLLWQLSPMRSKLVERKQPYYHFNAGYTKSIKRYEWWTWGGGGQQVPST